MPYEVWRSLTAQQKLQILEENDLKVFNKILKQLNLLTVSQEDFNTGEPNKLRSFYIDNFIIIYHISHRLKIIELIDIRKLD